MKIKTIILVLVTLAVVLCGCSVFSAGSSVPTPDTLPPVENLQQSMKSFTFLSMGAIVISVFALLNGSRSATAMIIASATGLVLSLLVAAYAKLIAFVCLAGALLWLAYSLFCRGGISLPKIKFTKGEK